MDLDEQLRLEDEFPFFVLLRLFVRPVIFPTDSVLTLPAPNVPDEVFAGSHVALILLQLVDVDDHFEEEGLAMLTAKILEAMFQHVLKKIVEVERRS